MHPRTRKPGCRPRHRRRQRGLSGDRQHEPSADGRFAVRRLRQPQPRRALQSRLRVHRPLLDFGGRAVSGLEVHRARNRACSVCAIDDCFCWNHGWQDFGFTARYNLRNDAFALTPSVSLGVPTHNYDYFGEAVLGRNLNEIDSRWTSGNVSTPSPTGCRCRDAIRMRLSRRSSSYRTTAATWRVEAGVMATRKLATRVGVSWQRSHGGLRSTEVLTEEQVTQYRSPPQGQQLSHHRRCVVFAAEGGRVRILRPLRRRHRHSRRPRRHGWPELSVRTLSASSFRSACPHPLRSVRLQPALATRPRCDMRTTRLRRGSPL